MTAGTVRQRYVPHVDLTAIPSTLEPYRLVESLDLGDNLDIQLLEAPQT